MKSGHPVVLGGWLERSVAEPPWSGLIPCWRQKQACQAPWRQQSPLPRIGSWFEGSLDRGLPPHVKRYARLSWWPRLLLLAIRLNKASVSQFRLPRKAYCLTRSCSVCADPAEISTGTAACTVPHATGPSGRPVHRQLSGRNLKVD